MLLQPLTQASVIDFLNVTADGGLIGPKMAILRLVWNHYFQCQKVCMLSFSLFSFFIFEAGIDKRDARP